MTIYECLWYLLPQHNETICRTIPPIFKLQYTAKDEDTFTTLKKFTNFTFNHHTENIIFNAVVRMQGKEKL